MRHVEALARTESHPRTFFHPESPAGLIARGLTVGHTYEAVKRLGLQRRVHLYANPLTSPLDVPALREFLAGKEAVLFVEDEDGFLEHSIRSALGDCLPRPSAPRAMPADREVTVDDVEALLAEHFGMAPKPKPAMRPSLPIPERIGTFCAICPHGAIAATRTCSGPALAVRAARALFLWTVDISAVAKQVKAHNPAALVVVDNTRATPLHQKPLHHGADISLHSATKFFSGHSDVMGGLLLTDRDELEAALRTQRVRCPQPNRGFGVADQRSLRDCGFPLSMLFHLAAELVPRSARAAFAAHRGDTSRQGSAPVRGRSVQMCGCVRQQNNTPSKLGR